MSSLFKKCNLKFGVFFEFMSLCFFRRPWRLSFQKQHIYKLTDFRGLKISSHLEKVTFLSPKKEVTLTVPYLYHTVKARAVHLAHTEFIRVLIFFMPVLMIMKKSEVNILTHLWTLQFACYFLWK